MTAPAALTTTNAVPDDVHHFSITTIEPGVIVFADGWGHTFEDPNLLSEALQVDYVPASTPAHLLPRTNKSLGTLGDKTMSMILYTGWQKNSKDYKVRRQVHDYGLAMDTYHANQADAIGLPGHLKIGDCKSVDWLYDEEHPGASEWTPQEWNEYWTTPGGVKRKATAVEALVGAIWQDTLDYRITKEFMRRMGYYWPENAIQENTLATHLRKLMSVGVVGASL